MNMKGMMSVVFAAAFIATVTGCAYNDPASYRTPGSPPPPPANYPQAPPLVALANRNGFQWGESDGARDADDRRPYRARSTRAYFDTPGFDAQLGLFLPYQNTFRNAYLRGYEKGFRHG